MRSHNLSRPFRTILALAGAGLLSAPALAQSDQGDFDKPLKARARVERRAQAEQPSSRTWMQIKQSDGQDQYEITIDGDQVSARVNGKDVPEDRIRRRAGRVEILDKTGGVISSFTLPERGMLGLTVPGTPLVPAQPGALSGIMGQPRVMLGINMDAAPDELAEQLQVDADEVIYIARVIEGSPAEKAGLKAKDVIVAIDGQRPATREKLHEVIQDKKPGDELALTVRRKDAQERTLKVELGAYDPEIMLPQGAQLAGRAEAARERAEAARKMAERMRELAERQARQFGGRKDGVWLADPQGQEFRFLMPGQDDAALKARMEKLDAQMAELDKKLDELNEKLARLQKSLDAAQPRR
jgi:hypothetical protein